MASPYTISTISDVPATSTVNLLTGLRGRVLSEAAMIEISLNREAVNTDVSVLVGFPAI